LEIRRLLANEQPMLVRAAWRDYQLQRDALQGLDMRFAGLDISARVQVAIADDTLQGSDSGARWWRPFASVAVAASVAMVVVIGARSVNSLDDVDSSGAVAQVAVAPLQLSTASNLGRVYAAPSGSASGNVAVSAPVNAADSGLSGSGLSAAAFPRREAIFKGLPSAQTVGFDADQQAQQRLQQYLSQQAERNNQGAINFAKTSSFIVE
jgi:negative regulator of sigma E activity